MIESIESLPIQVRWRPNQKAKIMTNEPALDPLRSVPVEESIPKVSVLPEVPSPFEPVVCYGWDPEEILPKRRPRNMLFLGATEWSWSPWHGRCDAYYLHRGRHHWITYIRDLDPNEPEFAWMTGAFVEKRGITARQAACHLMIARWREEVLEGDLDPFHLLNCEGFLSETDWFSIGEEVWPEVER